MPRTRSVVLDIGDLSVARDLPALDRVEVIDRSERAVQSADGDELSQCGLDVAGIVDAAPLQDRQLAVQLPWQAKPRVTHRQHGALQCRLAPGLAAVGGHLYALDRAAARPCEPGDLVETGPIEHHLAGGEGD